MQTDEAAQSAIQKLNETDLDGRKIAVNEARPKPQGDRGGRPGGGGWRRIAPSRTPLVASPRPRRRRAEVETDPEQTRARTRAPGKAATESGAAAREESARRHPAVGGRRRRSGYRRDRSRSAARRLGATNKKNNRRRVSSTVHLVNPSQRLVRRRRHHAALAVRAGGRDRARPGAIRIIVDETLEPIDIDHDRRRRRRRHRHPHRQRAARLRNRPHRARARRVGRLRRHSRDAVSGRSRTSTARAHAVVRGDGDLVWRTVVADCFAGQPRAALRRRPRVAASEFVSARWDLLPHRPLHVGVGADRARLPEALLVLLGVADRRPGAAAARRRSRRRARSSSCAASASASSRSPTTTSIRSRSTISRRRAGAPIRRGCTSSRRCARSASTLMAQLAQLPDDLVFYTQITMEAAEDPEFLDAMQTRAHPRRARRRRVGHRRRPEGRLQGLQPRRRRAGRAAARVPAPRRPRARLVHLRPAERSQGHVRRDRDAGRTGRPHVRAVRAADAVPRHGRFREVGGRGEAPQATIVDGVPITQHWLIPEERAAEAVHARTRRCRSRKSACGTQGAWDGSTAGAQVWKRVARRRVDARAPRVRARSRSCIGRCTRTPASRPTARACRGRRATRAGSRRAVRRLFLAPPMPELDDASARGAQPERLRNQLVRSTPSRRGRR